MPALVDAHCHISYGETRMNEELYFPTLTSLANIAE
jgi:imidazolonepropionase-like amidohydrolase